MPRTAGTGPVDAGAADVIDRTFNQTGMFSVVFDSDGDRPTYRSGLAEVTAAAPPGGPCEAGWLARRVTRPFGQSSRRLFEEVAIWRRGVGMSSNRGSFVLLLALCAVIAGTSSAQARVVQAGQPTAASATPALQWGLIGNRVDRTAEERAAGLSFKVVRLSWKDFEPSDGVRSASYVEAKRREIAALAADGMRVVLDLGLHDTPQWLHNYSNSYLVNQYGERWTSATDGDLAIDKSDANLIFNAELRKRAARYTADALGLFGAGAMAVRIGGGRYNELGYPAARTAAHANTYWAYDALAQAGSPVPGWKPGSPSANGEAGRFLEYYLGALEKFQRWQIATARRAFAGPLIVLHPSWGLRPGQVQGAVARNLDGGTSAEINGEVQRGHDVARFVAAVADPLVYPATTWLDAPYGSDAGTNMADWRPVHYLADLAARNPSHPQVWGENTGQADRAALDFSAAQARRFGLGGLSFYREEELFSGRFATLDDLRAVIAAAP